MFGKFYPYRPNLQGSFLERFHKKAKELTQAADTIDAIEKISYQEYHWATNEAKVNPRQRKIYRAVWVLLRDLLRVGWTCRWYEQNLEVSPPSEENLLLNSDINQAKATMRAAMSEPRAQKLLDSLEFIERMENMTTTERLPITALIADGESLARDLRNIKNLTNNLEKIERLKEVVKPYLQLVREGEVCAFTGQKLNDIWRYFRYTWATPYESTPGRTMQYLIRDAARPNHPVMGIASLENAPIIINDRDDFIGWTLNSFVKRVGACQDINRIRDSFQQLVDYIDQTISDINITGLCTAEECDSPSDSVIQRLITVAARTEEERGIALREWDEKGDDPEDVLIEKSELGNISKAAEEALYKRKRAEQLAKLLSAKKEIVNLLRDEQFSNRWPSFIENESGQTAIKSALIAQKSRHVGTSMMELNVCGAVPPYNEILGGKLAALVMLSKEVVDDYRNRYGNRPSDIASRLKGEPVIRQADLVYIGTTSLYKVGSSQYNRLKLPAGILRKDAPEVRWQLIGETKGFGTMHISRLALQCLEDTLPIQDRGSINRVFGEGASPKLRTIRSGLEKIFEPGQREFLELVPKHSMARLIYGAWLIKNGTAYLCGEDSIPDYYFDQELNGREATQAIVDYWRERWLLSRLNHEDALNRIAAFDPQTLLLSHNLKATKDNYVEIGVSEMPEMAACASSESIRDYLRMLYRGSSAYADRIDIENLRAIHVETSLDQEILVAIRSGKSVVLTGNPGDGKTHLIRILEPALETIQPPPLVEYDASRVTDEDLYFQWSSAMEQGRPFCVAINEAVLINLANKYRDFAPLQEARQQVIHAVSYNNQEDNDYGVVVFDLSYRNVLSEGVVTSVLNKLTDEEVIARCENCPHEGCDFVRNQRLLRNQQVRERLQVIFDRVSRRGYHATLRELQAFVSYLLFAGRDCGQMLESSGEDKYTLHQLIFSGEGKLFDNIRQTFDPSKISHPLWDDNLVYGEGDPNDWMQDGALETGALDPNNVERFVSRKRAFYFYNRHGMDLVELAGDDESEFGVFLKMPERQALRFIIQRINRFFGDDTGPEQLKVWQSHRYNQSSRRILYSALTRKRQEFEIVKPELRQTMANAFDLAQDHTLLRLKERPQAKLKIDFPMFELLAKANRGVPVMSLESDATRRIWQFMEQLSERLDFEDNPEVEITIFDAVTHQKINVVTDLELKKYLVIDSDIRR
jgi:hypothetical protein